MRRLDLAHWPRAPRLGRRFYPSVHLVLPPASGQAAVIRIIERIAAPQYTIAAPERDAWFAGTALSALEPPLLAAEGTIYQWWTDMVSFQRALQRSGRPATAPRLALTLRDPRDSAVSLYHLSLDPRHEPPRDSARYASYCSERDRIAALGLDAYVLELIGPWTTQLEQVADHVDRLGSAEVLFASYALLCHDFPQFLTRLLRYLRIEPPPPVVESLLQTEDVRRRDGLNSDSLAHLPKSSPMPGRFRRELQPETAARVTERTAALRVWMRQRELPALQHFYQD